MPSSSLIVKLAAPASLLERLRSSQTTSIASNVSSSTQLAPATKITDHFTQSQLSLALVISKSKPDGLSTAEYCQQLRKHIKEGASRPIENYQYIDTKQYWMDECNRVHKEKVALENRVACLEEAQRIAKEKLLNKERPGADETTMRRVKGTGDDSEVCAPVEAGIARKRRALSQDPLVHQDSDYLLASLHNDKHLQLSGQVLRIIRQRTQLQTAAQQCSTLDQITVLTGLIVQTIALLEQSLSDCCLPLKTLKTNSQDSRSLLLLQHLLHQMALSFLASFNAMNQLFLTIPGRMKQTEVISKIVMFFSKALDLIQTTSILQSEDENIHESRDMRNKRPRLESGECAVSKYLTQTLVSITERLEWKVDQTGHGEILEGMLFLIIQHAGRLISDCVFGEYVAASGNPGSISNSLNSPISGFIRPESRYVVRILHATLGGPDRKELVMEVLSRSTTFSKSSLGGSERPVNMVQRAKYLLQSSLLKSTIGGCELDSLRLPRLPAEISNIDSIPICNRDFGKEWLLETIWGLIGWDMVT